MCPVTQPRAKQSAYRRHALPRLCARAVILLLFAAGSARADDAVARIEAALAAFAGHEPLRARVTIEFSSRAGDKDNMIDDKTSVSAGLEENADDLQITWSRDTVRAANAEVRAASTDPDSRAPMRRAMAELTPILLARYLNGAPELLRLLGQSEFKDETQAEWQGRPARLLTFKSNPRVNAEARKYVKNLEASLKVWIGADGVPLAAERRVQVKGRALLVVTFESVELDAYEYAVRGDRLVVTRHRSELQNSGAGGRAAQHTVAVLEFAEE